MIIIYVQTLQIDMCLYSERVTCTHRAKTFNMLARCPYFRTTFCGGCEGCHLVFTNCLQPITFQADVANNALFRLVYFCRRSFAYVGCSSKQGIVTVFESFSYRVDTDLKAIDPNSSTSFLRHPRTRARGRTEWSSVLTYSLPRERRGRNRAAAKKFIKCKSAHC